LDVGHPAEFAFLPSNFLEPILRRLTTPKRLRGANLSEADPPNAPFHYGTIDLRVHKDAAKIKLAWKGEADLYYECVE